ASVMGVLPSGQPKELQKAVQHCLGSHFPPSHSTFQASTIGVRPLGQPMELQSCCGLGGSL
ncbi:MAG: hypothetical protein SGPRY_013997, partial [Prymnesium sp.]